MAAKFTCGNLKGIVAIFKILSNTDRSKIDDLRFNITTTNNFDDLLMLNLSLLWRNLENNEILKDFGELKRYFYGLFEQGSGPSSSKESNNTENKNASNLETSKQSKASNNSRDIRWIFCQICLQTLCCLKNTLQATKKFETTRDPAVDLSINDQQLVKTVIQFIVVLGLCPNLSEGVGIPIDQRTGFSAALKTDQALTTCPKCLYKCVMMLVSCLSEPSLSLVILSKHLADMLSALIQLGYSGDMCDDSISTSQSVGEEKSKGRDLSHTVASEVNDLNKEKDIPNSAGQDKVANLELSQDLHQDVSTKQSDREGEYDNAVICKGGILISRAQKEECKRALNNIVNKMYQPLIIRELLFLQGSMSGQMSDSKQSKANSGTKNEKNETKKLVKDESSNVGLEKVGVKDKMLKRSPKWMRDVCGHLLSKCLMKKNGVQSVLRAVLEGASGSANEWKICEVIAQVIANCPIQVQSPNEYYKSISPQVLNLLQLPSSKLQQQYSRASVLIIHTMLKKYPELATKYIAEPLMQPFLIATQEPGENSSTVLVDETRMTRCIEGLHKVFVASPNSTRVLTENMERIIVPVFELFCFVRHGASHVKTALLELLSTFFKRTNNETALVALYVFICQELPDSLSKHSLLETSDLPQCSQDTEKLSKHVEEKADEVKISLLAKQCSFGFGESGGVILQKVTPSDTNRNANCFGEIFGKQDERYETRALCLVEVLQSLRRDEIPGNFFLYLLQQTQEIILKPNFKEMARMKTLVIFNALALMCEKLGPSVLKNTGHMIQFIHTTLTRAHRVYLESLNQGKNEYGVLELETLTMALGMTSALLGGAVKVEPSDYAKLEALTPILREIAETHSTEEIVEQANDLLVVILTKTIVLSEKMKRNNTGTMTDGKRNMEGKQGLNVDPDGSKWTQNHGMELDIDFDTAFEQLCDPLLPVRGHALMSLANLLKSRDVKALAKVDVLVKTFCDNLIHDDSYIYLAAVEGLVAAADVRTDIILPYLARELVACCEKETEATGNEEDRGEYKGIEKTAKKKSITKRSPSTRLKVGEALVRAVKRCGELVPKYFQTLIHAFLVGTRDTDSFIRGSSLSNLAEMCRLSPNMIGTVVNEVFYGINAILKSDEANEVRQAAVLVLTQVLKGLGENAVKVLSDQLKDIYQLLKYVESGDRDETTRVHAQVALGELDVIVKEQLFPEQKLVKNIRVLPS